MANTFNDASKCINGNSAFVLMVLHCGKKSKAVIFTNDYALKALKRATPINPMSQFHDGPKEILFLGVPEDACSRKNLSISATSVGQTTSV